MIDTAWEIDAADVKRQCGISTEAARDYVILNWLKNGDMRPFSSWVLQGHTPSRNVLRALAVMAARADNPRFSPDEVGDPEISEIIDLFPLGLEVTGKGKKRADLANVTRDRRIAFEVAKQMEQGLRYDAALDAVSDWLADVGIGLSRDAVEKAYKAHRPRHAGTNSRQSVP